jgi:hypothetical protein
LRAGDGVHFTQAGARKLAHYVEREIQRWLSARATPVALPITEEPKVESASVGKPGNPANPQGPGGARARPLAGPVVPLISEPSNESEELLGSNSRQLPVDATASKVLVKGEPLRVPAGRADDFAWPRRGVAPVGGDPAVATTDLPMTPMLAERQSPSAASAAIGNAPSTTVANAAAPPAPRPPRRVAPKPPSTYADAQQPSIYRPDYRPEARRWQAPAPFSFPFVFGGR